MRLAVIFTFSLAITALAQGDWAYIQNLGSPPNSASWDYNCSINASGNKIFFDSNRQSITKIFVSEKTGSSWSNPQALPPPINDPGSYNSYWHSSSSYLYFSSGRAGGQGGADIWKSHWTGSSWKSPENLGSSVNTSANEYAGCISPNGNYFYFTRSSYIYVANKSGNNWVNARLTGIGDGYASCYINGYLYFSSDRSGGHGSNDIWRVQGSGTSWGTPQNLDSQINTSAAEGSASWTNDGKYMFFCSNKTGGYGMFDLYVARYTESATRDSSIGKIKALFY